MMFLTDKPIDLDLLIRPSQEEPCCGALALFVGRVRNHHEGRSVLKLFYDCYPAMAEKEIAAIARSVRGEFGAHTVRVIHRIGEILVGEAAVAIAVDAPHRAEAFAACRAAIDRIKHTVPIWKKEFYADGSDAWVLCSHAPADALLTGTRE